jgi:hypothetical protein
MSMPTEDRIRARAHELWEEAGRPEGRQDEFWHKAEQELADPAINSEESSTTFTE